MAGKESGYRSLTFPDGRQYDGDLKDGQPSGYGTMTYSDGSKYDGDFKNGILAGYGSLSYANGAKYDAAFKKGKYDGKQYRNSRANVNQNVTGKTLNVWEEIVN